MKNKKHKVVVIGCGEICRGHLQAYRNISEIEVIAVCDPNLESSKAISQEYDIPAYYSDRTEMLKKNDCEIVCVFAPDNFHKEICLDVIKQGKHILCEKPLCPNYADAYSVVQAAEKKGIKLMLATQYRLFPEIEQARKDIQSGLIGDVYFIDCNEQARWNLVKTGAKHISDKPFWGLEENGQRWQWSTKGVHSVDLVRYITGKEFVNVYLVTGRHGSIEGPGENVSIAMLAMDDGVQARIYHNWGTHIWGIRGINTSFMIRIEGEKGTIVIGRGTQSDPFNSAIKYSVYKNEKEYKTLKFETAAKRWQATWPFTWIESWEKLMRQFIRSIEQDSELLTSGKDHIKTLYVIEKGYESVIKKQAVNINNTN